MTDKKKTLNGVTPKEWDQVLQEHLFKDKTNHQLVSAAVAKTLSNPDDLNTTDINNIDGIEELSYSNPTFKKDWTTFEGYEQFLNEEVVADVPYKFNEGPLIAEFKDYIDSTYSGHYSKNKFQSTEFIIDCDHGLGFTLGNVLKYTQRYGKKEGHNRKDLLKILHYALIALSIHDDKFEK